MKTIRFSQIQSIASRYGLSCVSAHAKNPLSQACLDRLTSWQENGGAGELGYMQRPAHQFGDWKRLLAGATSIISFTAGYSTEPPGARPEGFGRVARYAWGRDYHRVLTKILKKVLSDVEELLSTPVNARIFTDAVPLLERQVAYEGGFGFYGKNSMLIEPGVGSYFLLAEILWDLDVKDARLPLVESKGCGSCVRCQGSCPTGALDQPHVVKTEKCISYLTIEKKGHLLEWERRALGDWVFGCDLCQDVCPFNHAVLKNWAEPHIKELGADHGSGPFLSLTEILEIKSDQQFLERFAGTPLMRAKRAGLLRNAACVSANTFNKDSIPLLKELAGRYDLEEVRLASLWALSVFAHELDLFSIAELRSILRHSRSDESSSFVLKEIDLMLDR